jgi:hypothetical protein
MWATNRQMMQDRTKGVPSVQIQTNSCCGRVHDVLWPQDRLRRSKPHQRRGVGCARPSTVRSELEGGQLNCSHHLPALGPRPRHWNQRPLLLHHRRSRSYNHSYYQHCPINIILHEKKPTTHQYTRGLAAFSTSVAVGPK